MSLKVVHDGWQPGEPMENCCLCFIRTPYWHQPRDVALCPSCAETAKISDLPTKAEWCAAVRARFPTFVRSYP